MKTYTKSEDEEMTETAIGPILSEDEFYRLLDGGVPALANAKELWAKGDSAGAKRLLAEHVRGGGLAEAFFENRELVSTRNSNYEPEKLIAEAERVLSHELKSVGVTYKFGKTVDWFYNATYNGYREWTWQLSRHNDILILAKAYEVFGDEKYAEGAVELLWSWIRQAVRPEADEKDGATLCWRTIECGIRMSVWPDIFFPILKSVAVTDDFILDFCRSLYEHGARLIKSNTQNNWRNIELGGFSSLCVLFPIFEVCGAWREHVAKGIYEFLMCQVHPDGFQFELSTGYHHVVMRESLHGAAVLGLAGYKMPREFDETIIKMFEMYALISQSGALVPDINDGRHAPTRSFMPKKDEVERTELIKWVEAGCGEQFAPTRDTLVCFENAGIVTMRDKWANATTSLLFDAGKLGRSHQHEDKLNVLIYRDGKELVAEGHNYAYDTSDMRKYVLSSFAHNTLSVDGCGQNRKSSYKWEPAMLTTREDIRVYSDECLSYASGEYSEAYGDEQQITDVVHKREVIMLRKQKAGENAVIVIDRLSGESEHTYEAMWHLDTENAVLDGETVRTEGLDIHFGGDGASLKLVKGVNEPRVQGFVCRSTVQGSYDAVPTVLRSVRGKNAVMLTVFDFSGVISDVSLDVDTVNITYKNADSESVKIP